MLQLQVGVVKGQALIPSAAWDVSRMEPLLVQERRLDLDHELPLFVFLKVLGFELKEQRTQLLWRYQKTLKSWQLVSPLHA